MAATVDRVMADERAAAFTRRSIKESAKASGLRLAVSMTDLTTLEGKDSPEKVRALCVKAARPDWSSGDDAERVPCVGAVCVYPELVGVARRELERLGADHASASARGERGVKVASVATGFPSGQYPIEVRLEDVRRAVDAGADEIDMVISRGKFLSGRRGEVFDEIAATTEACGPAHLKVILETGELETYDNVRAASDLAIAAMRSVRTAEGDFIKTSTGKVSPAATMGVTLVMLEAVRDEFLRHGRRVGVKPAGGIKTAKQALHYLVMVKETVGDDWLTPELFRFGASSLLNDLLMQLGRMKRGLYMAEWDYTEA